MEFKTSKGHGDLEEPELSPVPEKSMYLRKKTTAQVRKSYHVSRFILKGLRLAGQIGICLAVAGLLGWIVVYAYSSDRFVLNTVMINGCKHLDCRELEAAIRRDFPKHILQIDLKQLQERVESETWTRHAEIRRILPSEIVIYIQERTPLVILELRGELMLADEDGILLDKYDTHYGKLDVPVFKGILGDNLDGYRQYQEENSERVRLGLRMLAELESGSPDYTRSISEVDLSDRSNVRIMLVDDTAEIQFGDRDFLKRFNKLIANMNQYHELKNQYGEFASVDLRFERQIAYRRRSVPGSSAGEPAEVRR